MADHEYHHYFAARLPSTLLSLVGVLLVLGNLFRAQKRKFVYQQNSVLFEKTDPLFDRIPLSFIASIAISDLISVIGWLLPVAGSVSHKRKNQRKYSSLRPFSFVFILCFLKIFLWIFFCWILFPLSFLLRMFS